MKPVITYRFKRTVFRGRVLSRSHNYMIKARRSFYLHLVSFIMVHDNVYWDQARQDWTNNFSPILFVSGFY